MSNLLSEARSSDNPVPQDTIDWLPADVVHATSAHLDARDVCTLACVSRRLRRSVASASLSFTTAGTAHIQFEGREFDLSAAQTALRAFLERNASRVKALVIPALSYKLRSYGEDSTFLRNATRLQSLHIHLQLGERGLLPQSLTGLTYRGWSGSVPKNFDWTPFMRLASLRELILYPENGWKSGRLVLDAQVASCFSRLLDLRIYSGSSHLYLGAGLCLPSLTCLHLWDISLDPKDNLENVNWAAALPKLLSLRMRYFTCPLVIYAPLVLTSLPPLLRSLELCDVKCCDFWECVHLK